MANIWIGDLRVEQLKNLNNTNSLGSGDIYITDTDAEYSWFNSIATNLLFNHTTNEASNVIILIGLIDCIKCCTWSTFNIKEIAKKYIASINKLKDTFTNFNFFVCTVPPVDGDYASSYHDTGIIMAEDLNKSISAFNNMVKSGFPDTCIDCYEYLTLTSFDTYDGIRYELGTCKSIYEFISTYLNSIGISTFVFKPRIKTEEAPVIKFDFEGKPLSGSEYWVSKGFGGCSPCIPTEATTGMTMPSCTGYAWGRFCEILGYEPTLCCNNGELHLAEYWYDDIDDGYKRGQIPAVGAIACWRSGAIGGNEPGYVAIVEQVNSDGSIVTSESAANDARFWWTKTRYKGNGNWGAGSAYTFQGFIYNPCVLGSSSSAYAISKSMVTSSNKSLGSHKIAKDFSNISQISEAMKSNALYIWQYFRNAGWSINAVAALLGNMMAESTINPGRWESGIEWKNPPDRHGFGLVQWTPYTKYTDWCAENNYSIGDIDAALKRIELEVEYAEKPGWVEGIDQWITTGSYSIGFKEFTTSTRDVAWLAAAFLINYERPADQSIAAREDRGRNAAFWYEFLSSNTAIATDTKNFSVKDLKLNEVTATSIKISFVATKGISGSYRLLEYGKTEVTSRNLSKLTDELNVVNITSKIKPNTTYELVLEVKGETGEVFTGYLRDISTPQSYPESVKSIEFFCNDAVISTESTFKLSVKKPDNLSSYKGSKGYEEQLIVNGKVVKTKTISTISDISINSFTIKNRYGYNVKTGDTVQIGFRVWVENDKAEKIYDCKMAKTSSPICLLNRLVTMYLNVD